MQKRILILGAGGHGREVADILKTWPPVAAKNAVLGFLDDNNDLIGTKVDDIKVVGSADWPASNDLSGVHFINGIGFPDISRKLVERLLPVEPNFISAISGDATVSAGASLGTGVAIFPRAVVGTGVVLEDHVIVNVGATVSHDSKVGAFTCINPGARIAGNVVVGKGAYIGMGANVIQGVRIGEGAVVGAGATVIRDLPDRVTAVGVPARVIKRGE